jgi:hypothetical protein
MCGGYACRNPPVCGGAADCIIVLFGVLDCDDKRCIATGGENIIGDIGGGLELPIIIGDWPAENGEPESTDEPEGEYICGCVLFKNAGARS